MLLIKERVAGGGSCHRCAAGLSSNSRRIGWRIGCLDYSLGLGRFTCVCIKTCWYQYTYCNRTGYTRYYYSSNGVAGSSVLHLLVFNYFSWCFRFWRAHPLNIFIVIFMEMSYSYIFFSKVTLVLETIPAVTGQEVGYILDRHRHIFHICICEISQRGLKVYISFKKK